MHECGRCSDETCGAGQNNTLHWIPFLLKSGGY
jgi:hypothetical protein